MTIRVTDDTPQAAVCSVDECIRPAHAKALCSMHYQRMTRTGTVGDASEYERTRGGCDVPHPSALCA